MQSRRTFSAARPAYNTAGRVAANSSAFLRNRGRGPIIAHPGFRGPFFRNYGAFGFGPVLFWGEPYYFDSYNDCYYDPDYCYDYGDYGAQYPPDAQYQYQPSGYNGPEPNQPGDQDIYAAPPNGAGGAVDNTTPSSATTKSEEFVLVRNDGGLLFASGYIIHEGQLDYVDTRGVLRRVKLTDLDLSATRKWNDDRGNPISLPN
jgi:hypothetical protein